MKNHKIQIIIGANLSFQVPLGYRCFQIGCLFAEYDLFKPSISIRNFIYINFRSNLTHFYSTSRDRINQIKLCWFLINF